ncbi:MAG TPA: rhodanese-like domain-containing protein [Thermoanaerobaculia bacterium]
MKSSLVQAIVLIAAGFVLAIVSNAVASRDRRLVLPGYYPGATQVPKAIAPVPATKVVTPVVPPGPTPASVWVPASAGTSRAEARGHTEPAKKPLIVETPKKTPKPEAKDFLPHPDKPYIEVSGDEAQQLHANGALTLDARRTSVYEAGHIAGARSMSVWESDVDEKVNKLYEERSDPREQLKPILVYCSGGDCEDSHMLAQKLWGVQFNNVYVYKDGFPDWQKRGGSIHTGSNP